MTEHHDQHQADHAAPPHAASNRYILIAALAFAVVVAIYIVKTNLEAPKTDQVAATQDANSRIPDEKAFKEQLQSQISHVHDILQQDSTNFDAWAALGNLYFDADMPAEAIAHYRGALNLKPDDVHVLTDMATMLRAAGQPDTAVTVLGHALNLDSTLTQAWFNLGVIQSFDLKNHKEALHAWKKFLALSPPSEHTEAVQQEIVRLEKELGA